jgi:hypothetical protein
MNYAKIVLVAITANFWSMTPRIAIAETTTTTLIQDIKTKSYEILGKDTVTASFAEGSSDLKDSDRQNISAVVTAVRNNAVIESALVAGWGDHDYPVAKGQRLGKVDRDLASARVAKVKSALFEIGVKSVDAHSMAEKPTWLGQMFNTEDAKLKGGGKIRDANDELTAAIGQILRESGGPGKVVVIVRRQGDKTAH